MKRKQCNCQVKAVTIPEVLISAFILVIAFCALLLQFMTCIFLNEGSRNVTRATTHAQYIMEEIKDAGTSTVKSKIENGDWDLSTAQIISQGMGVLNSETIDAQVSGSGLLTVTVTVNW
ncbi:MAG: hypothetical protein ABH858_00760, partial [Candidatus Omnitrophota bacterium]